MNTRSQAAKRVATPETHATNVPAAEAGDESELFIRIVRWAGTNFEGYRSQIEAEGLVPANLRWPDRSRCVSWKVGRLLFSLKRVMAPGQQTGESWLLKDYWQLSVSALVSHEQAVIENKARELEKLIHHFSPQGKEQFYEMCRRHEQARADEQFQDVLARMTCGAVAVRRKRRSQGAAQ